MKNKLFSSIPAIILGILIAIAPYTFAPVCKSEQGMHMACYYTARVSLGLGIVIAVLGIIALLVSEQARLGLNIAIIVNAILEILVPTVLVGVCKMPMMHCVSITRPTLIVLSVLVVLFAAAGVYLDSKATARA